MPSPSRFRIWELSEHLHCSIIGTCLSTDELRRLLRKLGEGDKGTTDHELHTIAVGLAHRHDTPAKLLNKVLDERHRGAIRRFDEASDTAAIRSLWRSAKVAGDIPGAYWAALTHPFSDRTLMAEVFGDVHMLSHLVGAANRADIRRLAAQDIEIGALRDKVTRQQARLQKDLTERDARIRALQDLVAGHAGRQAEPGDTGELGRLVGDLRERLQRQTARREASEAREVANRIAMQEERSGRVRLEAQVTALEAEVAAAEAAMAEPTPQTQARSPYATVLYVGGRSGQTALLRRAAESLGSELMHFDAEQGSATLPGLVGRADLVVFPVDCVSHEAALGVKRLCRQMGRPFLPMRTTGAATLLAALRASR